MGLLRKQKLKPTDVLAAILAVDGKGSRLDADMVDGYHADEIIDGAMEQVSTITSYTAAENKIPMGKGTQGQIDPSWLQSYYTTSQVDNAINGAAMKLIPKEEKGAANGVATLDANSKIPLNQIPALQSKYLSIEGGDMVGDIVMHDFAIVGLPTPTVDDEAATKGYVDQAVAAGGNFLPLSGGTMQGNILIPDDVRIASENQMAQINLQESGAAGGAVNLISGTATLAVGDDQIYMDINGKTILNATDNQGLNFAGNILRGLGEPTAATDAATKGYVDQAVAASGGNEWDDMGKAQLGETEGYICFKRKIIGNGGNADGNSTIIYEYMIHSDYHDIVICRNPAMETGIEFDYFKGVEYITPPGNITVFNRYNLSGCAGYNFPIFYKTPLITTFNRFSFTNCNLQLANNLTNTLALNYDLYWLAGTVVSADMDVVIPAGTILSRWLVEATND